MTASGKSLLRWLLRFAVSFGLLAYVLTLLPLGELGQALLNADVTDVLIAFFFMFAMRYANAFRMSLITSHQGMSLSAWEIFKIGLITVFYGLFLPGTIAGGPIRWYMLSRKDSKPVETLASMAFARLNDTTVMVGVGVIFAALATATTRQPAVILALAAVFAGLVAVYLAVLNTRVTKLSVAVLRAIGLYRFKRFASAFDKLVLSMERYHGLSAGLRLSVWGFSLLTHMFGAVSLYFSALAIGVELPFADCLWIRAVIQVLSMMPISISGIGVRDGALVVLLAPFGVTSAEAVAMSFILLFRLIVAGGIGGLLAATNTHLRRPKDKPAVG